MKDEIVRTDTLTTKRDAAIELFRNGSPRVLTVAVLAVLVVRVLIGAWSWADAMVLAVTALLVGPVEWVIHLFLLHAPEDSFQARRLKTGAGHRQHHLDPPDVTWLLLRGVDAAVFSVLFAGVTAAWSLPLLSATSSFTGGGLLGPFLTALLGAYAMLLHYEWTHLLVHTRYRPRTRYYARLARNHRLHHYRNERYWLGVTANSGDRLLGTYPRHKSDVALSDTARTLS